MNATESSPSPPQARHMECVVFRPRPSAIRGSTIANRNVTAEYMAKQIPPHFTPSVYPGDCGEVAPKTLRATATPKNSHMQNSPSQVQNCTGASWSSGEH